MADEAVCCEPISVSKFPDQQGKYREFLRFWAPEGGLRPEYTLSSLGFLSKFPTQRNREFFNANRELFYLNRVFPSNNGEAAFRFVRQAIRGNRVKVVPNKNSTNGEKSRGLRFTRRSVSGKLVLLSGLSSPLTCAAPSPPATLVD